MELAFVLLTVETGSEKNVLKQLRGIDPVVETYVSYGVYDLIIKVKAETVEELNEIVMAKIKAVKQVRSNITLRVK